MENRSRPDFTDGRMSVRQRALLRLGNHQIVIMLAILLVGRDASAKLVAEQIEQRLRRTVSLGGVYLILNRLEEEGLVAARQGPTMPRPGGRSTTYFRLTSKGHRELRAVREELHNLWTDTATLL